MSRDTKLRMKMSNHRWKIKLENFSSNRAERTMLQVETLYGNERVFCEL